MEKLKKITDNWKIITAFAAIFISIFMFTHNFLNKYDDLLEMNKTTQQMALKSVIWNDSIPDSDRASACDVYLSAGYNSTTKKKCELIIEEEAQNGFFSYNRK